jgi:hypothetical protein
VFQNVIINLKAQLKNGNRLLMNWFQRNRTLSFEKLTQQWSSLPIQVELSYFFFEGSRNSNWPKSLPKLEATLVNMLTIKCSKGSFLSLVNAPSNRLLNGF